MKDAATLRTRQINHGQSEIWLEADGKELTERRALPTNEVVRRNSSVHTAHDVAAPSLYDFVIPEKAGGGSIPSLATTITHLCTFPSSV
jgi:hypothetical protein